jgi:hypothetical protein
MQNAGKALWGYGSTMELPRHLAIVDCQSAFMNLQSAIVKKNFTLMMYQSRFSIALKGPGSSQGSPDLC